MNELPLGPLIISAERAIWILAAMTLWLGAALISRKGGPDLNAWAFRASSGGLIGARLAFVLGNLESYLEAPLSILAFWQGGFSLWGGIIGFGTVSAFCLWRRPETIALSTMVTLPPITLVYVLGHLLQPPPLSLPDAYRLTTLQGQTTSLKGPAVINLWASWCPPCRREMPMMLEEANSSADLPFYFINQGEAPAKIRQYLSQEELVMDPVLDPSMSVMAHFGTLGLPATLFIDADGQVRHNHFGEISRAALRQRMLELQR